MYDYIEGKLVEKNPTFVIIEVAQIGYFINISLNTYTSIPEQEHCRLYIHQIIREDAILFFGFYDKRERELFRQLISVSGIGANTARLILSALSPVDIYQAINEGNVFLLKSIKGIGIKSAQRIIVDLKGKIGREDEMEEIFRTESNTIHEESLSALVHLGFTKSAVDKVIRQILADNKDLTVEEVVKEALKRL
ncbi:MAG: ATP-dependent DNA helicase RuvA [Bacteroides sp. SM23_62_1]|nr:MAG: ATP-dependent DNA helicase RuvA [Bacteroides sp. SM23_62_1]